VKRGRSRRPAPVSEVSLDEIVRVQDLAAGGRGVARLGDGRTLFIPGAFPGDVVRVLRAQVHASYVEARDLDLLEPSPERQVPVCADAGRCGGCDWMALSLPAQRRHKLSILRQSLQRVGRVAPERLEGDLPIAAGAGLGYRRRVRLHLEGRKLGFHSAQSHTLVEVERCHVCAPELWQAVTQLRALLADDTLAESSLADVVDIEVRWLEQSERPAVHLGLRPGARQPKELSRRLAEFAEIGGADFAQINAEVNRHLQEQVLGVARASGATTALDVYCGSGNFALPLGRLGVQTLGLEGNREAVRRGRLAASEEGLAVSFEDGDAGLLLAELAAKDRTFDLVVLDPPRHGAKGLGALLAKVCGRALVMISCDPVTLARDVADLEKCGLRLTRTMLLDMFPQTHHIESLSEFRPTASF
jgi:23S rRNA (uracil1939-C5)-methyltransferase